MEYSAVDLDAAIFAAGLEADFVGVNLFLVEAEITGLGNKLVEDRDIGDAEIVATGTEAFCVVRIGLEVVGPEVLQAEFRRPVRPLIVIAEAVRLSHGATGDQGDQGVGAVRGTGAADNRTFTAWADVDDVCVFFFIGVAQAKGGHQLVREGIIDVCEGTPDGVVLTATAIEAPRDRRWQRGRTGRRQVTRFGVGDFLFEIVQARRHVGFAERTGIAQFVGNLLLCELRTGVEQGVGRRINVADRAGIEIAVTDDVGDTAVAEIDIIVSAQRTEDRFGFCQTRLVDREVERVAVEVGPVLAGWAVTAAVGVFDLAEEGQAFRRREFQGAAIGCGLEFAVIVAIVLVFKIAGIGRVGGADLAVQHAFDQRAGDIALNGGAGAAAVFVNWAVDFRADLVGEFIRRIAGVHDDGAAGRVASEQQALRAAQDLDAVDVEQVDHHACVHAEVDAVDEDANGRIDGWDRGVHAETANGEVRRAARRADIIKGDVGGGVGQAFQRGDVQRVKRVGVEGGDSDGNVLNVLDVFLLGGGDSDRSKHAVDRGFAVGFGFLSLSVGRNEKDGRSRRKQRMFEVHSSFLIVLFVVPGGYFGARSSWRVATKVILISADSA